MGILRHRRFGNLRYALEPAIVGRAWVLAGWKPTLRRTFESHSRAEAQGSRVFSGMKRPIRAGPSALSVDWGLRYPDLTVGLLSAAASRLFAFRGFRSKAIRSGFPCRSRRRGKVQGSMGVKGAFIHSMRIGA
jgi:hypothetical protein